MREDANRIELPGEKNQKPLKEGRRNRTDVDKVIELDGSHGKGGIVKGT